MADQTSTSTTSITTMTTNQQQPTQQITSNTTIEQLATILANVGGSDAEVKVITDKAIDGEYIIDHSEKDIVSLGIREGIAAKIKKRSTQSAQEQPQKPQLLTTRRVDKANIIEWIQHYQPKNQRDKAPNPIDSFGKSFPFVGRDRAIQMATKIVNDRWACHLADKFDQKSHPIMVVAGSPGIGKTRLLYELPTLLQQQQQQQQSSTRQPSNFLNLYITYGNGESFSEMDQRDIVTAFSLRLLHNYYQLEVTLKIFISEWHRTFGSQLFIEHSLDVIKSTFKGDLAIYVSIDEFTQLLVEGTNPQERRKYLKMLVNAIGDSQIKPIRGVFLVAIFGGTIFTPLQQLISSSSYPCIHLPTPLLGEKEVRSIVNSTSSKILLKNRDRSFIFTLMLLGGWARSLDYFLEEVDKLGPQNASQSKLDKICSNVSTKLASIYPLSNLTQSLIKSLISTSITQLPVENWSTSSPKGSDVVYEQLEQFGYISRVTNEKTITVSFPLIYVDWTTLTFNEPAFILLQDFLNAIKQEDVFWQDWERYSATLLLLRCAMFEYLGHKEVTIQQLFGSDCLFSPSTPKGQTPFHLSTLSLQSLNIKRFSCKKLGHQYPTTSTKEAIIEFKDITGNWDTVYINADGAAFDWFLLLKWGSVPSTSLLICGQSKFSKALPHITCSEVDEEYNKTMSAVNSGKKSKIINGSTNVIFFVCTNRPYVDHPQDITPVSTVVADYNHRGFFGPVFSSLFQFYNGDAMEIQRNK